MPDDVPWAHFDMMAWNNMSRPGRPEGGEAQAARAIFTTIEKRIGKLADDKVNLILRSRAKRGVSKDGNIVMYRILRDARLRRAPQDEVGLGEHQGQYPVFGSMRWISAPPLRRRLMFSITPGDAVRGLVAPAMCGVTCTLGCVQ